MFNKCTLNTCKLKQGFYICKHYLKINAILTFITYQITLCLREVFKILSKNITILKIAFNELYKLH